MTPDWFDQARCADLPRDVFFSDDSEDIDSARRICGRCSVQAACLTYAFEAEATIEEGIFGGTTGAERKQYAKAHGIKPRLTNKTLMKALSEELAELEAE